MFAAWAGAEIIIAVSVALSGGPKIATMSWLAMPVVTLASRFSIRGIAAGVALALDSAPRVSFAIDPDAVIREPPIVIGAGRADRRRDAALDGAHAVRRRVPQPGGARRADRHAQPLGARDTRLRAHPAVPGHRGGGRRDHRRHRPLQAHQRRVRPRPRGRRPQGRGVRDAQGPARLRPRLPARRRGVPRARSGRRAVPRRRARRTTACRRRGRAARRRPPGDDQLRRRGLRAGAALDYPALFALADQRLYRAKHAGRNQVCSADAVATRIAA